MERITRDEMLLEMAQVVAKRGTCARAQVGCVISRDGRIISTGYNGAPSGMPHCNHFPGEKLEGGCQVVEHAERNAIAYAARFGVMLDKSELHCTHAPCESCAKSIINAGIQRVTYQIPYRLTAGVELLTLAGVGVFMLEVIDQPDLS